MSARERPVVLMRGGGDLATGVAYRLHQAGFPIIVLELPHPLVVRRRVALATAVIEGEIIIEGLLGRHAATPAEAMALVHAGTIPVLVSPELPIWETNLGDGGSKGFAGQSPISILIDARMAKRNIDTQIDHAQLVIALGPGFAAGVDCHAVIETMRGHRLGRVIWEGSAQANTGTPGLVADKGAERVLRAPEAGEVNWHMRIGDQVAQGDAIGHVGGKPVLAPFDGVLRGLIAPGTKVPTGLKIGDVDARSDVSACFSISDKALAIGGGVLEAIFTRGPENATIPGSAGIPSLPGAFYPSLSLPAALQVGRSPELVAIVGGGGKTNLMFALARGLAGRTVTTTTTRIFAAQMKLAPAICYYRPQTAQGDDKAMEDATKSAMGNVSEIAGLGLNLARFGVCLVVGNILGEKAFGVPPALPGHLLDRPDVDFVLVEADGSRMRPCKAPAAHEPVIPLKATLVVPVIGIDALGGRLSDVAHRAELVAGLTGLGVHDSVTIDALAKLITHPEGGLKGVPAGAKVIPFINKVETKEQLAAARRVARSVLQQPRIDRVVIGAVRTNRPVREIHQRVVAVVLAAGSSERMGKTKQLLPWGKTTVLGQTLRNVRQSAASDVVVVTGHEATSVEAEASEHGVASIRNQRYDSDGMLSSLQTAVRHAPRNWAAVLVVLADQPMVAPEIVDQLLAAYWQGKGELIAPIYQGRRGNPVLIGRRYFSELLALPIGAAPRDLLRRYQSALHLVEVDSDSVVRDLDQLEEYLRWRPPV